MALEVGLEPTRETTLTIDLHNLRSATPLSPIKVTLTQPNALPLSYQGILQIDNKMYLFIYTIKIYLIVMVRIAGLEPARFRTRS